MFLQVEMPSRMNRIFRYEITKIYTNKSKIVLSFVFIFLIVLFCIIGFFKLPKFETSLLERETILKGYEDTIDQLNEEIQQCKERGDFDSVLDLESKIEYYNYFLKNKEIEADYYIDEKGPFFSTIRFFNHDRYSSTSAMLYLLIPSFFILIFVTIYLINKVFLMDIGTEIKNIIIDDISLKMLFKNKLLFMTICIILCWLPFTIIGLFLGLFNSDVRMIFFINNQLLVKNSIEIFLCIQTGFLTISIFISSIIFLLGSVLRKQSYTNIYAFFIFVCIFIISKMLSSIFLKDATQGGFNDVVYYLPISSIIQSIYGFNLQYIITIIVHLLIAYFFVYLSYKQYIKIEE